MNLGLDSFSFQIALAAGTYDIFRTLDANDGVAPIYLKGHTGVVKAALLDAGNEVLAVTTLKGVNPFDWKPGQTLPHTVEVAFPHHVHAAKIALGVCSREGVAHPDIQLGIDGGTATNWYSLSDMPQTPETGDQ